MLISRNFIGDLLRVRRKFFYVHYSSTPLKEEKVKVDKWDINYLKVGKGPHNVLCLPGALGTIWTDFKPQIEGFDRDKFTLVVWDPPGYGKSRPPDKTFTADYYEKEANYAFKFMKALEIPKYSVLGWSDGGNAALILAAKYPEVMIKLVGFGIASMKLPSEVKWFIKLRDVNRWSEKMRTPMLEFYGDNFPKYWAKLIDGMEAVFKANNANICSHLLKDIKCPTFILYGEKDPVVSPFHVSHFLKHISNLRIHLYPDGKHNIHQKYAEDFNKRVQEFLLEP